MSRASRARAEASGSTVHGDVPRPRPAWLRDPQVEPAGPGRPLDGAVRGRMERALGHSFADVRIHAGDELPREADRLGAAGFAVGAHVGLPGGYREGDPIGDALLAHELAHVVQARGGEPAGGLVADGAAEREADAAAAHAAVALHGGLAPSSRPRLRGGGRVGLRLRACGPAPRLGPEAQAALAGTGPVTREVAEEVLAIYQQMDDGERNAFVTQFALTGRLDAVTRALVYADVAWGGRFVAPLRDLQQRTQRLGALRYAAGRGLASESAMVLAQASEMDRRNFEAARARLPPAETRTPTVSEARSQHTRQVEATSIPRQTDEMTPEREQRSTRETHEAVDIFVAWVQQAHPDLGITRANFRVAVREVFERGRNVLAFEGASGGCGGGTPQTVVGEAFNTSVRLNPAYALPTVIHELYGHREYGQPEYGQQIYDLATRRMATYQAPSSCGAGRQSELDAFGYQETEIYSWMRQMEYFTPTLPAHAGTTTHNFPPDAQIRARIGIIQRQYEPRVAESLLRGLYLRLRMDPRIVPAALEAFRAGVRAHFPAERAAAILS